MFEIPETVVNTEGEKGTRRRQTGSMYTPAYREVTLVCCSARPRTIRVCRGMKLPSLNFEETSTWHSGVHVVCPLAHTIPVCRGMKLPSVNSEETSTRQAGVYIDPVCRRFLSPLLCSPPLSTPLPAGRRPALSELLGEQARKP